MLSVSRLVPSMLNKLGPGADRDHGAALGTQLRCSTPCHFIWEVPIASARRNYNFGGETKGYSSQQYRLTGFFCIKAKREAVRKAGVPVTVQ